MARAKVRPDYGQCVFPSYGANNRAMLKGRCQAVVPPYSPDLNPIEEFFAELKAFVRRNWQKHTGEDFKDFLEWSLDVVGARVESAQGHFRHANVEVEEQK